MSHKAAGGTGSKLICPRLMEMGSGENGMRMAKIYQQKHGAQMRYIVTYIKGRGFTH